MPTKKDPPRLVLDLKGDQIPAGKFLSAARSFFDLLDEVASDITGKRSPVKWSVSVEKGSVILSAKPFGYEPAIPVQRIMSRVSAGLRELDKKPNRPKNFNDSALKHAQDLARLAEGRGITGAAVQLRGRRKPPKPVSLRQRTISHVESILGPQLEEYGSIEGYLETISIHGAAHFSLYDLLTNQAVRCNVSEDLLDEAWRLLRGKRRVSVTGFIQYRKSGAPIKIDVDDLVALSSKNIPASEVYGILTSEA